LNINFPRIHEPLSIRKYIEKNVYCIIYIIFSSNALREEEYVSITPLRPQIRELWSVILALENLTQTFAL
jgi:hypothetical protein